MRAEEVRRVGDCSCGNVGATVCRGRADRLSLVLPAPTFCWGNGKSEYLFRTFATGLHRPGLGKSMSNWTKDNDAHVATWMVEMAITNLQSAFADSPTFTMQELTRQVPGAGPSMNNVAIDAHMAAFFRLIKLYKPTWQDVTYKEGQETIRSVMANPTKTLEELASAVDSVLLFRGEIEGDYA